MIHKEVEIEEYGDWKKEKASEYEVVKAELSKLQAEDKKAAGEEGSQEGEKPAEEENTEKSRKKKGKLPQAVMRGVRVRMRKTK